MSEEYEVLQKMDMNPKKEKQTNLTPFQMLYSNFEQYSIHYTQEDLMIIKEYVSK